MTPGTLRGGPTTWRPNSRNARIGLDDQTVVARSALTPPHNTGGSSCRPSNPRKRCTRSSTFELATALIRPGGHVANIGVHGKPATLHLESLWSKNVTITTGLVDTYSTPTLLRLTTGHQLYAGPFVTHHFTMGDFIDAYDTFARAADTGALKVVLTPGPSSQASS